MNYQVEFENWLYNDLTKGSGAPSAYMYALNWLSDRFYEKGKIKKKSIFEIDDIQLIQDLYAEALINQRDITSYIFNKNSPSYGKGGYYSASLNKYKQFLMKVTNF